MTAVPRLRDRLASSAEDRPRASYRDDLVTALLAMWFVVGLFLDAWAHNNLPGLETFFTPWHAVFYSGFTACAGWICWLGFRHRLVGEPLLAKVPVGYSLAILGLPLFALAGIGDYTWHAIFGIEQSLKILFSPTHLVLAVAGILIVTSPLRSAWADRSLTAAPSLVRLVPAVLTLGLATSAILLFLQYANALVWGDWDIVTAMSDPLDGSHPINWPSPVDLVSAMAVTNVVLLLPLLLLAKRWRVPAGSATILFAAPVGLSAAITELHSPSIIIAVVVAGLGVDALLAWLRPAPARRQAFLAFAALGPLVIWSTYLAGAFIGTGQVPTVVEYWTGAPIVAALLGLAVGVVCLPATETVTTG